MFTMFDWTKNYKGNIQTLPTTGVVTKVVVGGTVVRGFEQLTLHTNSKEVDPGKSQTPPPSLSIRI